MNAIVAVDEKWGIGKNNDLLFHIPADMKFFREKTLNKVVVMGSNTLLSFPDSKPLKNRINVVLYPGGKREDCLVAQNMQELVKILSQFPTEDIFVVGGAMFYKTMLAYCDKVYVTKVKADGDATHFFENLDKLSNWKLISIGPTEESNGYKYNFTVYQNNAALMLTNH